MQTKSDPTNPIPIECQADRRRKYREKNETADATNAHELRIANPKTVATARLNETAGMIPVKRTTEAKMTQPK